MSIEYDKGYVEGISLALAGVNFQVVSNLKYDKRRTADWVQGADDGWSDAEAWNTLPRPVNFNKHMRNKGATNFYEEFEKIVNNS